MRTKYFLTALALPAVFAACTSDEFDILNSKEEMKNRIELQNVSFGMSEASTRLVQGDTFNELLFQNNDGMGASLIDVPNGTWGTSESDHVKWYNLNTDKVQTNYRYNYADGSWTSQANLVEGNYMFYMPYGNTQSRGAMLTNLPTTQALAKGANGEYSTFSDVIAQSVENGAPLVAGYKFLKEGDSNTKLELTLQHLYAYPKITLANTTGADVEISQLILSSATPFIVSAPFKYAATANQTAYTEADGSNNSFVDCFFDAATATDGVNGNWSKDEIDDTEAKATSELLGSPVATVGTSGQISIQLPDNKLTIKKGENFSFYVVIPAGDYTSTNALEVSLYTTDGKSGKVTLGEATMNPGKRFPVEEYTANGVTIATKGDLLTGAITTLNDAGGVAVSDNAALIAAINAFAPTNEKKVLDIRIVGDGVSINNLVASVLKNKTSAVNSTEINFLSDAVIENAGALETTSNITVTFEGNVTMKGASTIDITKGVEFTTGKTVTVAEGANVTLKGTMAGVVVKNNGTLNVSDALTVASVANAGTLNLSNTLTAAVENTGTVAATTASASIVGAVANKGSFSVAKGAIYAQGTGAFTNAKDATLTNLGTITSTGTIVNNGTIVNGAANNTTASLTASETGSINNNLVTNFAVLTLDKNVGTINMESFMAEVTIEEKEISSVGNIYNNEDGTVNGMDKGQNVWKTLSGNQIWPATTPTNYNAVVYDNAKVTVTANEDTGDDAALAAVKFNGGSLTVTGGSSKVLVLPVAIDIAGVVTFEGVKGGGTNVATIECNASTMAIEKEAVLNLKGGDALTVAGDGTTGLTIKNSGTVNTNVAVTNVVSTSTGVWVTGTTAGNANNWVGTAAVVK